MIVDGKPTAQARWLSFALVAFPVGLIAGLAVAMWLYYANKDKERQRTYGHALALRRDVNEADLERYQRVFSQAAALAAPERHGTVCSFIESTLGGANMGYVVRRDAAAGSEDGPVNLSVELPGTRRVRDVVLVFASHGAADGLSAQDAGALSVLLSLAHSFTGAPQAKTLRFLALDVSRRSGSKEDDLEKVREGSGLKPELQASSRQAALERIREGVRAEGGFLSESVDLNEVTAGGNGAGLFEKARNLEQALRVSANRL
jgi:hypothetical protein